MELKPIQRDFPGTVDTTPQGLVQVETAQPPAVTRESAGPEAARLLNLGKQGIDEFKTLLWNMKEARVDSLDLSGKDQNGENLNINAQGCQCLADLLKEEPTCLVGIKAFNFSGASFGATTVFLEALSNMVRLLQDAGPTVLKFAGAQAAGGLQLFPLQPTHLNIIAGMLHENSSIRELDLSGQRRLGDIRIPDQDAGGLYPDTNSPYSPVENLELALRNNRELKTLNLCNCNLNHKDYNALVEMMNSETHSGLERLDLSKNLPGLTNALSIKLAGALMHNRSLKELFLPDHADNPDTISWTVFFLQTNRALQTIEPFSSSTAAVHDAINQLLTRNRQQELREFMQSAEPGPWLPILQAKESNQSGPPPANPRKGPKKTSQLQWRQLRELGAAEPVSGGKGFVLMAKDLASPEALDHAGKLLVALLDENAAEKEIAAVLHAIVGAPYCPAGTSKLQELLNMLKQRIALDSLSALFMDKEKIPKAGCARLHIELLHQYAQALPDGSIKQDLLNQLKVPKQQVELLSTLDHVLMLQEQPTRFFSFLKDDGDRALEIRLADALKTLETQKLEYCSLHGRDWNWRVDELQRMADRGAPVGDWRAIEQTVRQTYRNAQKKNLIKAPEASQEGVPQHLVVCAAILLSKKIAEDDRTYKLSTAKMTGAAETAFRDSASVESAPAKAHGEKCAELQKELPSLIDELRK